MAYTVIRTIVEGVEDQNELTVVQLDAPDGMFVVSILGNLAGGNPDYALSFLGWNATLHSTSIPGGHQVVLDDDGRVTGVVFFGMAGPDLEVGIVCVD